MFAHLDRVFWAPIGFAVILPCSAAAVEPPGPCAIELQRETGRRISDFAESGSTPEVLRKLVRSMSMRGRILGSLDLRMLRAQSARFFWLRTTRILIP